MAELVCEDHFVAGSAAGLRLFVRNKRLATATDDALPVLFVHGATYPSSVTFDYAIDGVSWMDVMAAAGFDVWCVDLIGYGGSDRPVEMAQPAADNPPAVDTERAVADIDCVVNFVLKKSGQRRLKLIGYSWGTKICGDYAGRQPDKVARLVLYGAGWLREKPSAVDAGGDLGAYRLVEADAIGARWLINRSPEEAAMLTPPGGIEAWAEAAIASDPESGEHDPPRLRAPTGVVKDGRAWNSGVAQYDPAKITAPTLVVVGEWDEETTPVQCRAVFEQLDNAGDRRLIVIGRATHSMLLEKQRHVLHRTVDGFLREE